MPRFYQETHQKQPPFPTPINRTTITTVLRSSAKVVPFILICEAIGLASSIFTLQAIPTWYATLTKPSFNPPNAIFGPVWTLLYALMGVSLYLVWKKNSKDRKLAVSIFAVQLALNALWSVIFFGLRNPSLALVEIVILWIVILTTIVIFYRTSKPAALLLIPYLAWTTFATFLNLAIVQLN